MIAIVAKTAVRHAAACQWPPRRPAETEPRAGAVGARFTVASVVAPAQAALDSSRPPRK